VEAEELNIAKLYKLAYSLAVFTVLYNVI